jgi:tetratricopeptide (TPR) repeat protein
MRDYKQAEIILLKSYNMNKNEPVKLLLGQLYYYIGKYDKSIEFYKNVKNIDNDIINLYNLSFSNLAKQNFKLGFQLYENRLKENKVNPQTNLKERVDIPTIPYWNGIDKCNNLLVIYEQGIGDNIQYFRFIIELSKRYPNMKISYFCKNILSYIFKKYDNIEIIDNVILLNYNYKLFIMSLPYILNLKTIEPNKEDYIKVDNDKLEIWNKKISDLSIHKKHKIGFAFKGLLSCFIEKYIPLHDFQEQLGMFDIDLFHKGNTVYGNKYWIGTEILCKKILF